MKIKYLPIMLWGAMLLLGCNTTKKISSPQEFIVAKEDEVVTVLIDFTRKDESISALLNSIVIAPGNLKANSDELKNETQFICLWKDANENTLKVSYMDNPFTQNLEAPSPDGSITKVQKEITDTTGVARTQYVSGLSYLLISQQNSEEPIALIALQSDKVKNTF